MKIVFMGTPDFAVPTLKKCIEHHDVVAVFTQPDKPKGRGNKMLPPPVKVTAQAHDIVVHQPERIKRQEWVDTLNRLKPDVIVVVAYGQILSKVILDIPTYGCINVHGSLLPKYRGAAPIQWAVANGELETGVTTMLMDIGIDDGDMLLKAALPILPDDHSGTLHDKLSVLGADLLIETLEGLQVGRINPIKQNDAEATHAGMLDKSVSKIDWHLPAKVISDKIRGFNPWPIAHTVLHGIPLKVFKGSAFDDDDEQVASGAISKVDKTGIYVQTGLGLLRIDELQWGSHKRMTAAAFLLGHDLTPGTQLGEMEDNDVL